MYEMEGASQWPRCTKSASCPAFQAPRATRWCRILAAGTGYPIPATFPKLPPE